MLAPMVLADRRKAWSLALLTTVTSVVGGLAGFAIGAFAIEWVIPLLERFGYMDAFLRAQGWFERWGFWAVLAAGFSPIPYKVFTIAAGALAMPLLPFALASVVGRGGRFFLVAGLIYVGGESFERNLKRYVDILGWAVVVLVVIAVLLLNR
jgi:membrane protein YqaA with SNARE-associated domain